MLCAPLVQPQGPISVAGAVKEPITFQAGAPVTLVEAIARAGGLTPAAGPEILVVKAQDSLPQRVTVQALIDGTDPGANLRLSGGEEVRVPEAGMVFVVGNVKRPGAYPVEEGAETSVLRMLAVAGGLAPFAGKRAFIYRREGSRGKHEIPIELSRMLQRKARDAPLRTDDVLYITDNRNRRLGPVLLEELLLFGR